VQAASTTCGPDVFSTSQEESSFARSWHAVGFGVGDKEGYAVVGLVVGEEVGVLVVQ
jgi:hypothetical protein